MLLLMKASADYPNQAPDLKKNPYIIERWHELLKDVDPALALSNLDNHSLTSEFFPVPANIAKKPTKSFYDNDKQLAQQHILMIEESAKRAVPMPEHIRKELLGE